MSYTREERNLKAPAAFAIVFVRQFHSYPSPSRNNRQLYRAGKQVADFSKVELRPLSDDVDGRLQVIAKEAAARFELNQVLVVHRLGTIEACESGLLAIVSEKPVTVVLPPVRGSWTR
ncbi:molybdenum cofactor biosynthesis protein MoaE [Geomonas sp. RF6]|uniref:molybdenum cofactor biosynthesis protein MoaE n=1 Tax=Geomonas sp. RF6 TaxID=2897342 RepID=UPI001E6080BF|nr:molybdenum cofactor biosynthesis protein MoaE [Geomonas sp. RF6]UFS70000.1 molybdenum cofactor biosynthesis protein MoaE [Geomonas sp. RF6]